MYEALGIIFKWLWGRDTMMYDFNLHGILKLPPLLQTHHALKILELAGYIE